MSATNLEIRLDRETYEPGELVRGRVRWNSGGEIVESLLISLLWHTAGKGTEDVGVHNQVRVRNPMGGDQHFDLELPEFPWSFSGELISLIWSVEAVLEPGGVIARTDLISAPGGEEVFLQGVEDP